MKRTLLVSVLVFLPWSLGCRRSDPHRHESHDHEHAETLPTTGLTHLRVPPPRLEHRWMPGEAVGDETTHVLLTSPVKGFVERLEVPSGRTVAAGTALIHLRSPELAERPVPG